MGVIYKATDRSIDLADVRKGKIVESEDDGRKESCVLRGCIVTLKLSSSRDKQYFVNRNQALSHLGTDE